MGLRYLLFTSLLMFLSCNDSGGATYNLSSSGSQLYLQRCASCHGPDGDLKGSSSPDLSLSKMTADQILYKINIGGNGMPAFKRIILDSNDKRRIVNHVLTLKK